MGTLALPGDLHGKENGESRPEPVKPGNRSRFRIVAVIVILAFFYIPLCLADPLSISADPGVFSLGDRVELSGTTEARDIIAVYLLIVGPGLDARGVCLENLNLPAGQGYFTSARVKPDGTWRYEWNTAYVAGNLQPGTYTVYVENVPLNLHRMGTSARAGTNLTMVRGDSPGLGADMQILAGAGMVVAALLIGAKKRE
jgi:hypothetical protein